MAYEREESPSLFPTLPKCCTKAGRSALKSAPSNGRVNFSGKVVCVSLCLYVRCLDNSVILKWLNLSLRSGLYPGVLSPV